MTIFLLDGVTFRNATKWPETLDAGSIVLTGLGRQTIADAVGLGIGKHEQPAPRPVPAKNMVENST